MMDFLFVGFGWTDRALALNRIAVGAFFMLSGYHKLFNAERRRLFIDELKGLGVPAVDFNYLLPMPCLLPMPRQADKLPPS